MFFSLSNNVLPYKRVCNKEDLVNSSNVGSVLFKVLRRVYRSSLIVGQWTLANLRNVTSLSRFCR